MKKISFLIIMLLCLGVFLSAINITEAASTPNYRYESDTIRWYYEKTQYERPYDYWAYYPYYYYISQYPNTTYPYFAYYYPYYYTGYSYRNVKVYEYFLKVDASLPKATVSGEGWYREGTSATITTEELIESPRAPSDTQYLFSYWSGDYSGSSATGTVEMDSPKSVTANYKTRYHIQAQSNPVEVLGFIEDNWYDEEATKVLQSAPEIIDADHGQRYVFESWYIDGNKVSGNPISVKVDNPLKIEAKYKIQYYLDVRSLHGLPEGSGWYDKGSTATFNIITPIDAGIGRKWVFEMWEGDVVTASPQGTVVMDKPISVTALWRLDSTVLYTIYGLIIAAIIILIVAVTLLATRGGIGTRTQCPQCGYRLSHKYQYCPICGSQKLPKQQKTSKNR